MTQTQNRQPSGSADIPPTVCEALERAAMLLPQTEALVGNGERINFERLRIESLRVARGLAASGIRRGDHVAICAGNSVEWAILFHGIVRVGAVCVPVNTRLMSGEIRMQLERADARMLLTVDSLLKIDFIAVLREVCPTVETALPAPELPL